MKLNESSIAALSQLADPIGIISLYAGRPADISNVGLRVMMKNLERDLKDRISKRDLERVHSRVEALAPELDRLEDQRTHGRGHALFAPVTRDVVETIDLQLPLPTSVVFDKSAFLNPLVAALDEGRPAGLITVHKDGAQIFEWRIDGTEELERHNFDADPDGGRTYHDEAPPLPQRLDSNRSSFYKAVATALGQLLGHRGWERLVVFGDRRIAQPMVAEIPSSSKNKLEVFFDDRIVDDSSPEKLQRAVAAILHDAQLEREVALVRRAKELALSRSRACLGLRDTLEALNQSRVQHLLIDPSKNIAGFKTIDGQLFRERDKLAVQGGLMLLEERKIGERMVKRAIEIGARVTPVEQQAARELDEHDGVAALLRW